ncbi:MAG: hypothetical protein ACTSWM_07425 [Alphaproteobacteria bacterium]
MSRLIWLAVILTGCAQVVAGDADGVVVRGSDPRAIAQAHCDQYGKFAVISAQQPLDDSGVRYRCV